MLFDKFLPYEKKSWLPITVEGDGPLTASKFSGRPWFAAGEDWPKCANCGEPMQFFLQINLGDLPKLIRDEFGSGLLQFFYCINQEPHCETECEAFFPFAESELLRLVQPRGEEQADPSGADAPFPARRITDWQEVNDLPHPEEVIVELSDEEWEAFDEAGMPRPGDKLSGWPAWVQGVEYPDCPKCNKQMRLVLQLDSRGNLPFDFGDAGTGHITQCEEHKDVLAFGWACS